jgi:C_GCAxxG_C_C family probable redox protein
MGDLEQMMELKSQGFVCSQIILKMGLDLQGKENPDLIRAMQGLAGGLGYSGDICGALTAGVCLLGLYAGKGTPEQEDNPKLIFMIEDLLKWFKGEYAQDGSTRCESIVGDEAGKMTTLCPQIIASTFQKAKELLVENGFDLSGTEE